MKKKEVPSSTEKPVEKALKRIADQIDCATFYDNSEIVKAIDVSSTVLEKTNEEIRGVVTLLEELEKQMIRIANALEHSNTLKKIKLKQ